MELPESITIVESSFMLDGGTTILHVVSAAGEGFRIRLNERMFDSFNAGRLYFNDELIEVRSDEEAAIVDLLRNASIAPKDRPPASSGNKISKDAMILGDDIREVFESSPEENLRNFRDFIVEYVESPEYVQIAKHGPPKRERR